VSAAGEEPGGAAGAGGEGAGGWGEGVEGGRSQPTPLSQTSSSSSFFPLGRPDWLSAVSLGVPSYTKSAEGCECEARRGTSDLESGMGGGEEGGEAGGQPSACSASFAASGVAGAWRAGCSGDTECSQSCVNLDSAQGGGGGGGGGEASLAIKNARDMGECTRGAFSSVAPFSSSPFSDSETQYMWLRELGAIVYYFWKGYL